MATATSGQPGLRRARRCGRGSLAIAAVLLIPTAAPAIPRAEGPAVVSLAESFDHLARESEGQPEEERVARVQAGLETLLGDFYRRRRAVPVADDRRIAQALRDYANLRERFLAAAEAVETRYGSATTRFRRLLPDFQPLAPVYVLHSLGEFDGGTRLIGGRVVLVFGADVIAAIHDDSTVGPLVDHELFHGYHRPLFGECAAVWCALWVEGLATYVASRLNPGASDRALLLEFPRPIRPALKMRFGEAVCLTLARLDSSDDADLRGIFAANGALADLPPRHGYFIGLRLFEQLARRRSVAALAHLDQATARRLVDATLREMAPCP